MYYYTDPDNFRDVMDFLETIPPIVGAVAATTSAVVALVASAAGSATSTLVSPGSTSGFKQHMLTSDDEGKVTTIILNGDNTVKFQSVSGDSTTGVSAKKL